MRKESDVDRKIFPFKIKNAYASLLLMLLCMKLLGKYENFSLVLRPYTSSFLYDDQ
jgi:hypothetical protein